MDPPPLRERALSTASSSGPHAQGHRRTKSAAKPTSTLVVTLFLTNARLLDLDLLPDYPDISAQTLIGNYDGRARIRAVEFVLFHLFKLYDPATTADKLQPFYPPLEPLQSINLRAALFRCLNELKKNGVLGKEIVLRKSLLDDCQGDKLWELCLAFSAVVLRKVTLQKKQTYARTQRDGPVAERLGTATALTKVQREALAPLSLAHRVSLNKRLEAKQGKNEAYGRLFDALAQKEAELAERRVLVQERARVNPGKGEVQRLDDVERLIKESWVGSKQLQDTLLGGPGQDSADAVLSSPLPDLLKPKREAQTMTLLQALEQSAAKQAQRVRRWQTLHEQLQSSKHSHSQSNGHNTGSSAQSRFEKHRTLSLHDVNQSHPAPPVRTRSDRHVPATARYDELLTAMREELRRNRQENGPPSPIKPSPSLNMQPLRKPSVHLDTTVGAADPTGSRPPSQTVVPMRPGAGRRLSSRSRSYIQPKVDGQRQPIPLKTEIFSPLKRDQRRSLGSPLSGSWSSVLATPVEEGDAKDPLDAQAAEHDPQTHGAHDSGVGLGVVNGAATHSEVADPTESSASSPESQTSDTVFKKPILPAPDFRPSARPSLAERTRQSMAFRSNDDITSPTLTASSTEEPTLSMNDNHSQPTEPSIASVTLLERTRQSISLAPQPPPAKSSRTAAHSRTRSSIVYPVTQFETPNAKALRRSSIAAYLPISEELQEKVKIGKRDITPREQLFSPDAEYDSVFKARPKVKLSPVLSPVRVRGDRVDAEGDVSDGE